MRRTCRMIFGTGHGCSDETAPQGRLPSSAPLGEPGDYAGDGVRMDPLVHPHEECGEGMSLVASKAKAHPQQVANGTAEADRDERYTPLSLIRPLHARWRFTVDAAGCASAPASQLIGRHWSKEDNGLIQPWDGERVWCNPPYSGIGAWVEKAWNSLAVVVMLLPANRTEQPWWQEMVEPHRDRPRGILTTEFLPRRIQFGTPDAPEGKKWASSPPFGCVLVVWRNSARQRILAGLGGRR